MAPAPPAGTTRRRLLQVTGGAAVAGLAGCLGTTDDDESDGGVTIIEHYSDTEEGATSGQPTSPDGTETGESTEGTEEATDSTDTEQPSEAGSATRQLRIISADGAEPFEYAFTIDGEAELVTTGEYNAVPKDESASGRGEEIIENGDGTVTIRGIVAGGGGDTFRFTGEITASEVPGPAAVYVDGELVEETDPPGDDHSCVTIDEPGEYVLTRDIESSTAVCIDIQADGVTFDGDGHTITGSNRQGTGISARGSDVTIRNVAVSGFEVGIEPDGARVHDCAVTENGRGIELVSPSSTARIVGSEISNNVDYGVYVEAQETATFAVRQSRVAGNGGDGIFASVFDITVEATEVRDNDGYGIRGADGESVISNATIRSNGGGIAVEGVGRIEETEVVANATDGIVAYGEFEIQGSTVRDNGGIGATVGTSAAGAGAPTITSSAFTDNGRHGLLGDTDPDDQVIVTDSTIADNDELGISNEGPEYVDARNNYWGSGNGPSSPDDPDAPFKDPESDVYAVGNGDAVSEGDRSGVSNVRFAPWLAGKP